jgi:hypothetical protein
MASIYLLQHYVFINIELWSGAVLPHFETRVGVLRGTLRIRAHCARARYVRLTLTSGDRPAARPRPSVCREMTLFRRLSSHSHSASALLGADP